MSKYFAQPFKTTGEHMKNIVWRIIGSLLIILFIACSQSEVTTESGLKYTDIVTGDGDMPEKGQTVVVHYTGLLEDGKKFDSSYDRNAPIDFIIGTGQMIPGFDEGIQTMKKGGKRKLVIPPYLAYGSGGIPNVIPPDATIIFEVELVDIK
ncbi:MAG: FKBP-type peptidyl-prolyl cis-trans isomerase [Calditrichaceae bacterium]|nr:FKBP-type peptidyl-prolyl cis-trans isomerase [Calditrichaceae bacterium]